MVRCAAAVCLVFVVGCGEHGSVPGLDANASDAHPHTPPDAPFVSNARFRTGCAGLPEPATVLQFSTTELGQTAVEYVTLEDPDHRAAFYIVNGPDAQAFRVEAVGSGPVRVVFTPSAARTYTGTLHAGTLDGIPIADLAITATVVAGSGALVVNTPSEHMGWNQPNYVVLTNRSASTQITLDPLLVTTSDSDLPDFAAGTACGATLLPGETCTVNIAAVPWTLGCRRAELIISSSENTVGVKLDGAGLAQVSMQSIGGTVSSAAGTCTDQFCDQVFGAEPMTFTATPDTGYRFIGWNLASGCGNDPVCTLEPPRGPSALPLPTLYPAFALDSVATTTITIAGAIDGRVIALEDGQQPVVCDRTCTIAHVTAGTNLKLVAASTAAFASWSGACTGSYPQCNVGQPGAVAAVTATFVADPGEVLSVVAPPDSELVGFLPGGDFVVGGAKGIERITPAGAAVWRRTSTIAGLVTSPTGRIYYLRYGLDSITYVTELDGSGAVVWARRFDQDPSSAGCGGGPRLAVTASGDVAVMQDERVRVLAAATGVEVWTAPAPGCRALAASPTGSVVVASQVDTTTSLLRFDATGVRQLPDWSLGTSTALLELAFDAQGNLVAYGTGGAGFLRKLDVAGTQVFSLAHPADTSGGHTLAVATNGTIATLAAAAGPSGTFALETTSASGVPLSSTARTVFSSSSLQSFPFASALVSDSSGHIALLASQVVTTSMMTFATTRRSFKVFTP